MATANTNSSRTGAAIPVIDLTAFALTAAVPSGENFMVRSFKGTEQLGRLFEYTVELSCTGTVADFNKLLGDQITISVKISSTESRYFNGFISRFKLTRVEGNESFYRATVVPWLWFLTQSSDCRIFQGKTVPQIIEAVFKGHEFSNYELRLSPDVYKKWEYSAQYRETDFNYISRLMEQEGIYYYFKHESDENDNVKHTLVLADSIGSHDTVPGYEEINYYPPTSGAREAQHIYDWSVERRVKPGSFRIMDYDFTKASTQLENVSSVARSHASADYEIFDYPGGFEEFSEGEEYAKIRIQELQAGFEIATALANTAGLTCGASFKLCQKGTFLPEDQIREYLVTSISYDIKSAATAATTKPTPSDPMQHEPMRCEFTAIDKETPYRSPRVTPLPEIRGPQTAVVVGSDGDTKGTSNDDIYRDKFGRVRVRFHWDRAGASSFWIRVSQAWAGKHSGGMFIPHPGQEVIVDFLEGDPDRPVITGCLYNSGHMPKYLNLGSGTSGQPNPATAAGDPSNPTTAARSQSSPAFSTSERSTPTTGTKLNHISSLGDSYGNEIVFNGPKTYGPNPCGLEKIERSNYRRYGQAIAGTVETDKIALGKHIDCKGKTILKLNIPEKKPEGLTNALDGVLDYTDSNRTEVTMLNREVKIGGKSRISIGGGGLGVWDAGAASVNHMRPIGAFGDTTLWRHTVKEHTSSDTWQFGDSESFFAGFRFDGTLGLNTSIHIGGNLNVAVAPTVSFALGPNVEVSYAPSYSLVKGEDWRTSKKDTTSASEKITMQVSPVAKLTNPQKAGVAGAAGLAGLVGAAAAATVASGVDDSKSEDTNATWGSRVGFGTATGLWAAMLFATLAAKKIKPNPTSKIEMTKGKIDMWVKVPPPLEDGIEMAPVGGGAVGNPTALIKLEDNTTTNKHGIGLGTNTPTTGISYIKMGDYLVKGISSYTDERIVLVADKDIMITSLNGNIKLNAPEGGVIINCKDGQFNVNQGKLTD